MPSSPPAPILELPGHHFRGFDSRGEKANPTIDLPQPPLAVPIVGVVTAIAIAGSPRDHLRYGRAFSSYIRTGRSGRSGITNLNGGRRTKACDSITFCSHRICRSGSWTAVLTDGRVGRKTRATMPHHGSCSIKRQRDTFLSLLEHAITYLDEFSVSFHVAAHFF